MNLTLVEAYVQASLYREERHGMHRASPKLLLRGLSLSGLGSDSSLVRDVIRKLKEALLFGDSPVGDPLQLQGRRLHEVVFRRHSPKRSWSKREARFPLRREKKLQS